MSPDHIQKQALLRAPRARVWRAVADAAEFGAWFGMALDGPFRPGAVSRGVIRPTTVDAEVAAAQQPYAGTPVELFIERIEPERLFSFRWHPYAVDRSRDYALEPMTLVTFTLEDAAEAVRLTVTESGFEQIPLDRRAQAFQADEGGWAKQVGLIAQYLALAR